MDSLERTGIGTGTGAGTETQLGLVLKLELEIGDCGLRLGLVLGPLLIYFELTHLVIFII